MKDTDRPIWRTKWPYRQNAVRWDWRVCFAAHRLNVGGPVRTLATTFLVNATFKEPTT